MILIGLFLTISKWYLKTVELVNVFSKNSYYIFSTNDLLFICIDEARGEE